MRVCSTSGCPNLTPKAGRCTTCERAHDKARGTRSQRGYDAVYDRSKRRVAPLVAKGIVMCWTCGERISPLDAWDQGHCDINRAVIHGPQHRACNSDTSVAGCVHTSHT